MKVKEIIQFTKWLPNTRYMEQEPKFTIMMPTYRRFASGHLTRAIQSVLDQTYPSFELIVIDDGSVDGSYHEVQRFMTLDPRIHCLHHPRNVGLPAIGCYEAFLKAHGEYLMFCFDDTTYQVDALQKVAQYVLDYQPKIAFGYIDYHYQDASGQTSQAFWGKEATSQAHLTMTNFLPNLGAIVHREVPHEIGFLDPHFGIARLTDWDYWKRAARFYELHYSGIHIGTEFGLTTNNSLGLTYPVNQWAAYEWTERARETALIPGAYEEYDVQHIPEDLSEQSRLILRDLSRFYEKKFWYESQASLTLSIPGHADGLDPNMKLLVLTLVQDAAVTQVFEHLPRPCKRVRYVSPIYFDERELVSASALIISRHLFHPDIAHWLKIARQLGIPHYYFLDENPLALTDKTARSKEYSIENLRKELHSFHGVLASNQSLADFLSAKGIHSKVYLFPPVMPSDRWMDRPSLPAKPAGATRIGFISQPHLQDEFARLVFPALARLAKDCPVELVILGDLPAAVYDAPHLKIYQLRAATSHRVNLGSMQRAEIDVLVSPGRVTGDFYETPEALLNAWVLNAVPILANQPPYLEAEESGLGILGRDMDEWYDGLRQAVTDPAFAARLKENLDRHVTSQFSGEQNLKVLKLIDQECPAPGIALIDHRFRIYLELVKSNLSLVPNLNTTLLRWVTQLEAWLRKNRGWLLPPYSPQERFVRFVYRNFLSALRR